jgi:triosephosphate isomerase
MMRKTIVAGNWKMHKTITEGLALATEVMQMAKDELLNGPEVVLLPPFTHLFSITQLNRGTESISLGAQNCHAQAQGAYTGEVSASMLASVGCSYCLVGHSERRQYNHEKNAELAEKVNVLLANGIRPIYCCGETLTERETNQIESVIEEQISQGLFHLSHEQFEQIVIA